VCPTHFNSELSTGSGTAPSCKARSLNSVSLNAAPLACLYCSRACCQPQLVLNFALGRRSQATTDVFIKGLRHAIASDSFQISTDGFKPYVSAITTTLPDRSDFAQLFKSYTNADPEGQRRYSPPDVTHTEKVPVMGNPDPHFICTSHVERQNLTIRMSMRRLTRLTNAFSKKWENLWAAYCLHFAYYTSAAFTRRCA